jgi:hypothetical protein
MAVTFRGHVLRRLLTVAALGAALTVLILLARAAENWHYVVSGAPGTLLYAASFDGDQQDWQTYSGRLDASIEAGVLRVENGQSDSYAFSVADQHYDDLDLRARAVGAEGPLNNGYGVVFRYQNPQNFYAFLVSSDGYYSVVRALDGDQRWLSNWIDSPMVIQGIGAENRLRVVASGDQFRFWINDMPAQVCVPDDPAAESTYVAGTCREGAMLDVLQDAALASGQVGVVALTFGEPDVVATFDDIVVYSPEANR